MKKIIAMLLALIMVCGLVACGSSSAPAATNAPAADAPAAATPAAAGKISIMASQDWIKDAELALAEQFTAQTGIEVDYQIIPADQYPSVLTTKGSWRL